MTDSTDMISIQSIIATHTASLEEATSRHSNNLMRELLNKLAQEYNFDADAAAEKFLVEAPCDDDSNREEERQEEEEEEEQGPQPAQARQECLHALLGRQPFFLQG